MSTPSRPITECASKLQKVAREHPTRTLLAAIGCGIAVGFVVRTLRPRTPASRTARLLADVRHRLHDIAVPVRRQTEHLVESSADAVKHGVAHLQDLHLERGLLNLGQRFRKLFR
jgi:ribosomal protein S15P/S13E